MSKFDELCESYKGSRDRYFSYRDESFCFADDLIGKYVGYLAIAEEYFKFVPLDKTPKKNTTYSLPGAIHLGDDGYWYLGFQITLYSEPDAFPQQPLLLKLMFKKVADEVYNVRISEDDSGHNINTKSLDDFYAFFDFLQSQIRSQFENSLQEFLEQSAPLRTIGFVQS